jgi:hypothetical protein
MTAVIIITVIVDKLPHVIIIIIIIIFTILVTFKSLAPTYVAKF